METDPFHPGQRIASNTEPELGLGLVMKVDAQRVEVFFPAPGEQRQYARRSAPLRRVRFKEGDRLKLHSGEPFVVEGVEERDSLLVYLAAGREIPEAHLADTLSFSSPAERLFACQADDSHAFTLRAEATLRRADLLQNPTRGLLGARVELLPHQMFIANEVAARRLPRVLLADEVGLGKTIEAGLILHRLHLTGRASRILLVLPEALVHQWFVEMYRRFNLLFSIFDAQRCEAIALHQPEANPFLENQLILCSLSFLSTDPVRAHQAREAGWDLLLVDEAHHLQWSPQACSPEYSLVEDLARATPSLLLLTATPQQLGPEGHFARLRLLDPTRYPDLEAFLQEADHYEKAAAAIGLLLEGNLPKPADLALFSERSPRIATLCKLAKNGGPEQRAALAHTLLDAFGTGRVMFRNTRAALKGFPRREASLHKIKPSARLSPWNAKIKWLADFLRESPATKILLICKTRELAETIQTALLEEINVASSLFHEGLTLAQRDRNAAFFADEEGVRLLLCSEMGSEGRNFQFAHDLVLFDLPENPELLEQRIGRLDRIGQTSTIHLHVPYLAGGAEEVLARWYQDGLDAFQNHCHGALEIAGAQAGALQALQSAFSSADLKALLKETVRLRSLVQARLQRGYDRLLEWSSCRKPEAEALLERIRLRESDPAFEDFLLRVLDSLGVGSEPTGRDHRSHQLQPGPLLQETLPGLPPEGLSVTFQRERANFREDVTFLSEDHPLAAAALDLLLGGSRGNAACAVWKGAGKESLLLEVYAVVECLAPRHLHADRFLPAVPVRMLVDHENNDLSELHPAGSLPVEDGDLQGLLNRGVVRKKLLPAMLEKARQLGEERTAQLVASAKMRMHAALMAEQERLEELREINDHVRPEELDLVRQERAALEEALTGARLRVDALRLILRTP